MLDFIYHMTLKLLTCILGKKEGPPSFTQR